MNSSIKIAYIILCHDNLEQTNVLINQLDDGNCNFFVHIDKKADVYQFDSNHVTLVPNEKRVDVKWGHISMIYATINAMSLVERNHSNYDYVFLISGQDFPLKSNIEIQRYLTRHDGCQYIEVLEHSHKDYLRYLKRNSLLYNDFLMKRTFLAKMAKKFFIFVTGGKKKTFKIIQRKDQLRLTFEFGSQWWALTFDCFMWILKYIKNHPEYLEFYKKCLVPDESFFQTVFMHSPFRSARRDSLTYLDWTGRNHPKTFLNSDFKLLMSQQDKLFARKFNFSVDKSIVDMIINKIR